MDSYELGSAPGSAVPVRGQGRCSAVLEISSIRYTSYQRRCRALTGCTALCSNRREGRFSPMQ
jgi:hypothetical protein